MMIGLKNFKTMELKYGRTDTYKYNLDKEKLDWLTSRTNRSNGQTQFLFQLVDGDFEKLKLLEMQLKNCFVGYCPGGKKDVERIMNLEPKCDMLKL